jgi:ABC-type glycerol-3-phosphate transport system substrate-binding protein
MLLFALSHVFGGGQSDADSDTINLTWQVWVTPNLSRVFYEDAAQAYMSENPDVTIEVVEAVAAGSGEGAVEFIRNRLAAGDVPDIWTNVLDAQFIEAGHLWEIPVDDPDLKRVKNLENAAVDGKYYAFTPHIQPQGSMFYNKKLWAQAGLTEADIPRTWTEFEAVADKIKAAGLVPIMAGGEWTAWALFQWFLNAEVIKDHPQFWSEYKEGKIRFTDSEVLAVGQFIDRLVKKEYFIKGQLSIGYAQLEQGFIEERAVIYPMGTWYTAADKAADKDWETGVFIYPTSDGESNFFAGYGVGGNSMRIYSGSPHPDAAWEFVKWIHMNDVYGSKLIEVDGLYSNLTPPVTYEMTDLQKEISVLFQNADKSTPQIIEYVGDAAPSGITDVFQSVMEAIITQTYDSLEEEFAKIDAFVAESSL